MSQETVGNAQTTANSPAASPSEPIAIIGIGCRFPGSAHSPESFWNVLCQGIDTISEVPADRWSITRFYDADPTKPGKTVSRWGGFVDQRVDTFDAFFFGMSPREAAYLDPMQRWLLEVAWEALEDAGQVPERLAGSNSGVFIGAFTEDVKVLHMSESNRELIGPHTATGTSMTLLANRLSYVFDFHGPSLALDTACSSSLVAVHLACQSIWNGESSLALAGGVNAMFRPEFTIAESKAGMLSPDGRSKAFDSRANGYVRGEGAGIVVLKPLSQALTDGDPVYAVIRSSGVNQDGRTKSITIPNGLAQQALIHQVCQQAGVSPGQIQYVEVHGTGTPVGDPIEANAVAAVVATDRAEGDKCLIGSVKTNIGHLEAAAGIAGLIKVALCLKHGAIPPHLHFLEPNPKIALDELAIRIPQTLEPWPTTSGPRLASVNSFGFGGTNAHVLLEAAPTLDSSPVAEKVRMELLPLSARSPEALQESLRAYHGLVQANHDKPAAFLRDLCYSASLRRGHHDHRLALRADSLDTLSEQMAAVLAGETAPGMASGRQGLIRPRLAFVFGGMGPQWWAMGRQLLSQEPVFRAAVEQCDLLLSRYADWSLLEELQADEAHSRMAETQIAQPANFALQVGLAQLWRSWGVVPDAIVGHSAGEVAAAYIAGVLSLEDAVLTIYHRSRLQHMTTGQGKLVAVGISLEQAQTALATYTDQISIAAVNSASAVTLVGEPEILEQFVAPLREQQVFVRFLRVEVPYHSHYMNPLHDELIDVLKDIKPQAAQLPLFSTVTGARTEGSEWDGHYWWKNVRDSVLFAAAADALCDEGYTAFLEIAPHPVLAASIQEQLALRGATASVMTSLRRDRDERTTMLEALGSLYAAGYPVDWSGLYRGSERFIQLPLYPWQRDYCWAESEEAMRDRLGAPAHALLGDRLSVSLPIWENRIDVDHLSYLADHCVQGTVVYPGAAYIEMMLASVKEIFGSEADAISLSQIVFHKALFLPKNVQPDLQLSFDPSHTRCTISSRSKSQPQQWIKHASAQVRPLAHGSGSRLMPQEQRIERYQRQVSRDDCYRYLRNMGLEYGPRFQGIQQFWHEPNRSIAQVALHPEVQAQLPAYGLHPVILDVCFQIMLATTMSSDDQAGSYRVYLPTTIEHLRVYGPLPSQLWTHSTILEFTDQVMRGNLTAHDEHGRVVIEIEGCVARSIESLQPTSSSNIHDLFYTLQWQAQAEPLVVVEDTRREPASWLILADQQGVASALAKRLEAQGDECLLVYSGQFRQAAQERSLTIDPSQAADVQQLIATALSRSGPACRGIIHLWSLDSTPAHALTVDDLERSQLLGPITVLHLVQALDRSEQRHLPRLWLVTKGAHALGDDSAEGLASTALWGLGRVIGYQEHPDLFGGLIDLDPAAPSDDLELLLADLTSDSKIDQVSYRNGQRYTPCLAHPANKPTRTPAPAFRADGSYLITGGLGGLGLQVARWMVEHGARRLILMGRTKLPPRGEWSSVEPGTPLMQRISAIRELEALGASVQVAALDVADEAALAAFLAHYRQEGWPPIRGLIHAAGVTTSRLMAQMTAQDYLETVRSKVYGAWSLHQHLADAPLDFFVLFSSVAALGFTIGQSDYAAANAFLDGLAHYRRTQGLPAISINWGPWAEAGMATKLGDYFQRRGIMLFPSEQGLQALAQLLHQNMAQTMILGADWSLASQHNFPPGGVPSMLAQLISAQAPSDNDTQDEDAAGGVTILGQLGQITDQAEQHDHLAAYLQHLVARVLRLNAAQIGLEQPINTFGVDSMMAIELKNLVEADLQVNVSVVDLLQGVSVSDMTRQLLLKLQPTVDLDIDDLVTEMQDLSPEELQQLLESTLIGTT